MTAINILVLADSASIITDSKALASTGHSFNVAKVRAIPHLRLAIATRGPIAALEKVERELSMRCQDFDSVRTFLGLCYGGLGLDGAEVFIAGISAAGPAAFMISAVNSGSKILDIPYLMVTPVVSQEAFEAYSEDPLAGMLNLLNEQGAGHEVVGGFVSVTTVREATIESYVAGVIDESGIRVPMAACTK